MVGTSNVIIRKEKTRRTASATPPTEHPSIHPTRRTANTKTTDTTQKKKTDPFELLIETMKELAIMREAGKEKRHREKIEAINRLSRYSSDDA
jgi:hypothetical protein